MSGLWGNAMGLNSLLLSRARANHPIVIPPIADVWTTAGNYPSSFYGLGGAGSGPTGVVAGGSDGVDSSSSANTFASNVWSVTGSLLQKVLGNAVVGSASAALSIAGDADDSVQSKKVAEFNGSTWSSKPDASIGRRNLAGAGSVSAALAFAGADSGGRLNSTESFNGTSWSGEANCLYSTFFVAGAGTASAAVKLGGIDGQSSGNNVVENFNGTSWSYSVNYPVNIMWSHCVGTPSNILSYAGNTGPSLIKSTYHFNGTSWSARADLGVARSAGAYFGTPSYAVAAAGASTGGSMINSTQYYS